MTQPAIGAHGGTWHAVHRTREGSGAIDASEQAGAILCAEFLHQAARDPLGILIAARLRSAWPHSEFVHQQDLRRLCRRLVPMASASSIAWIEVRCTSSLQGGALAHFAFRAGLH